MPVFQGGGEMIKEVTFEKTTYNDLPYKFEAGTPNIADTIAFKNGTGLYQRRSGKKRSESMKPELLAYATAGLREIPGLTHRRQGKEKVSVMSFVVESVIRRILAYCWIIRALP